MNICRDADHQWKEWEYQKILKKDSIIFILNFISGQQGLSIQGYERKIQTTLVINI